ncbi:MAG: glutaredoxin family protein [Candidatus Kerfeldbacteria bacterium]
MAVTIYSTPTCPYCKMAKDYFKENKVEYEDVDVAADQDRAQEMIEKSGQMGVPVIVIPGDMAASKKEEVVIGFDRDKLEELLGIKG